MAIRAVRGSGDFFVLAAAERHAYADAAMELICTVAQGIVVSPCATGIQHIDIHRIIVHIYRNTL